MSKLEQLLLKINEVKTLTEQQTDETLSTVLQTNVQNFVKESLNSEKDMVKEDYPEYEEEVVGAEPSLDGEMPSTDPTPEMGDEVNPEVGGELEMGVMDASPEMEPDTADIASDEMGDDDEVLDLTDASLEEVLAALEDMPDDTVIEIVKNKPTYDVKASDSITESSHENNEDDVDEEEINEWIESALQESANQTLIDEYKTMLEQYERKLSNMEKAHAKELTTLSESLQQSKKQVKQLKEEQSKYSDAISQSHQLLEQLAVHNTNLLHITKLFTEQSISKNEKVEIARQFDNVTTINESKILFEALSKTLPKKDNNNEVQEIKEEMKSQTTKKEIIKEEKTFNDPDFERFNKLIAYKI